MVLLPGFFVIDVPEEALLIKQDNSYGHGNARIGNVEDWPEENKRGTSAKPLRVVSFNDGKVEHIYHFSMEQGCIAPTHGKQSSRFHRTALSEYRVHQWMQL